MDYQKVYNLIILNAKNSNRKRRKKEASNYIYYERHHIIPKCLGGLNNKENLVLLTAREHFVCHKLLVELNPKNKKLIYALWMMSFCKNKDRKYKISSREYERNKKLFSYYHSGKNHTLYGKTGKLAPMYNKHHTKESREKMSKSRLGKSRSKESILKQSLSIKGKYAGELSFNFGKFGELNNFFGMKHSEEALIKMRLPKSEEHKQKIRETLTGKPSPKPSNFSEIMSKALKGKLKSDKARKSMSECRKGKPAKNKGIPMSEEQKEKLRKPRTEEQKLTMRKPKKKIKCKYCDFYSSGGNITRWHNENCKQNTKS